jgi:carboxyl-terminal processing protease
LSPERRRGFVTGLLAGITGGLGIAALLVAVIGPGEESDVPTQARETIEDNYFKDVQGSLLDNASVNGMIRELRRRYGDRVSQYFNPKQLEEFESHTSGRFSGVGLTVSDVKRGLRVASVLPDTPAERADIEDGDLITAVDGRSIRGVPAEVSTARIKGPPGTPVELRVVSAATGKTRDVTLRRASVEVPAADGEIERAGGEKVAYVRFATFNQGAHGDLRSTLERLYRRGARGLLLDLRGNGGGLLNEAVLASSLFLREGELVVSTDGRTTGHTDYHAQGDPLPAHPTVVLINRDTASAAEILASALADNRLATIAGTRSFGKGTFQEVLRLPAGGALDLTVGQYFTSDGDSLADEGIRPDVRAVDDPKTSVDEGRREGLAVLARKLAAHRR